MKLNFNPWLRLFFRAYIPFVLPITIQDHVVAATFYINNSQGIDGNKGTSANSPWKTISKVNGFSFQPGDTILFKRGNIWREMLSIHSSGSATGYIVYSAYGTGEKPTILGSEPRSSMRDWRDQNNNIWETTANIPTDPAISPEVGNIILVMAKGTSFDTSTGVRVINSSDLNSQGKFLSDVVTKKIRMYSKGNPAAVYISVECAVRPYSILISLKSYIKIENLILKYASRHGISIPDADHVEIRDCDISYVGGSTQSNNRLGNGIEFWGRAENCLVERCSFHEIYDAALTNQWDGSTGPANQKNISYTNNVIWNAEYSFEFWNHHAQSVVDGIYFEYNTCINAGGGWGHNQRRNEKTGWHVCIGDNPAKTTKVYIRHNIFANSIRSNGPTDILCGFVCRNEHDVVDVLSDKNCWFIESGSIAAFGPKISWSYDSYRDYVAGAKYNDTTFQDKNSVFINPLEAGGGFGSTLSLGKKMINKFLSKSTDFKN